MNTSDVFWAMKQGITRDMGDEDSENDHILTLFVTAEIVIDKYKVTIS